MLDQPESARSWCHVGLIVGQQNGQWIVKSGNDGNRVRTRPLPVSNAIAFRWGQE
jgi:hypothetical protein